MSNIGGAIFGLFCMFVVVAGVMYVAAMNNQSGPTTDTYGNTLGNTTNTSQSLAISENLTPGFGIMLILDTVIVLIMVIFGFYIFSKTFQ
jgi:hypothetical protein